MTSNHSWKKEKKSTFRTYHVCKKCGVRKRYETRLGTNYNEFQFPNEEEWIKYNRPNCTNYSEE